MSRLVLALALLCHLGFATVYAVRTPAFEGPDENAHAYYVSYLMHTGRLPVISPDCSPLTGGAAAHHPPLYYAVLGLLTELVGSGDYTPTWSANPAWRTDAPSGHEHFVHGADEQAPVSDEIEVLWVLRGFSVLCGLATVALTFALGRVLFAERPQIAAMAALLLACIPQWTWMHGCLDSGNLAASLATATLLVLVQGMRSVFSLQLGVMLGVLAGLALITKLTALFLLPLLGVAYGWALYAAEPGRRGTVLRSGIAALVALAVIAGWSFVRNAMVYGDPFMLEAIEAPLRDNMIAPEQRWHYLLTDFPARLFGSAIAAYGWAMVGLPAWAEVVVLLVIAAAAAGWLRQRRDLVAGRGAALVIVVLTVVVVGIGVARLNSKFVQPQGRYLFPAYPAFVVLLSAGLSALLPVRILRAMVAVPIVAGLAALIWVFAPTFPGQPTTDDPFRASYVADLVSEAPAERRRIELLAPADGERLAAPPMLRWRDPSGDAAARYTVILVTGAGLPVGTHEFGGLALSRGEWALSETQWQSFAIGEQVRWKVRRLPDRLAGEEVADMVESPFRVVVRGEP